MHFHSSQYTALYKNAHTTAVHRHSTAQPSDCTALSQTVAADVKRRRKALLRDIYTLLLILNVTWF
jgi:hypothetical protein